MNLKINLKDNNHCNGCPCLVGFWCHFFDEELNSDCNIAQRPLKCKVAAGENCECGGELILEGYSTEEYVRCNKCKKITGDK